MCVSVCVLYTERKKKKLKTQSLPTVENSTPEPGVHRQKPIDMPQTGIFIVCLFIFIQRQLIVQKDEKG